METVNAETLYFNMLLSGWWRRRCNLHDAADAASKATSCGCIFT